MALLRPRGATFLGAWKLLTPPSALSQVSLSPSAPGLLSWDYAACPVNAGHTWFTTLYDVMWTDESVDMESLERGVIGAEWRELGIEIGSVKDKLAKAVRPGGSRDRSAIVFIQVKDDSPYLDAHLRAKKGALLFKTTGVCWKVSGVATFVDPRRQVERAKEPRFGLPGRGVVAVKIQAQRGEPLVQRFPLG